MMTGPFPLQDCRSKCGKIVKFLRILENIFQWFFNSADSYGGALISVISPVKIPLGGF